MTRKGALFSDSSDLWKLEKQIDAINQHSRLALSLIRKEIRRQENPALKP